MKEEIEELSDALWMIREREKINRQSQDENKEEEMKQGSDVCYCGDYRSQHGKDGCGPCGLNPPFVERCMKFRWGRKATAEERKHWWKYHSKAGISVLRRISTGRK